jgi:hypothetical protein
VLTAAAAGTLWVTVLRDRQPQQPAPARSPAPAAPATLPAAAPAAIEAPPPLPATEPAVAPRATEKPSPIAAPDARPPAAKPIRRHRPPTGAEERLYNDL